MKNFFWLFGLLAAAILAAGCSVSGQYARQPLIGNDVYSTYGMVPQVFVNPSPGLIRRVWLFRGPERVELVPDARTGGWMFNRRPEKYFELKPANGFNWHSEGLLNLPRDTSYIVYDQAVRAIGRRPVGQPNIIGFTTGSNPMATIYYQQSPLRPQVQVGGVVYLPFVDPRGPDRLQFSIEIDPQAQVWGGLDQMIQRR